MSEHQYIAFRAIDAPVSKENLAFMRRQSTRAEITPWRFDNEYHWGDFRGDALEMLRRGYDFHFHYANFGVRSLYIRLPCGFPDPKAAKHYLGNDALQAVKDKTGSGVTLVIEPYFEPGEMDELWNFKPIINRLVRLRAEILAGDLRPLYLAHLAVCGDSNHDPDETIEGPVPAGLAQLSDAQAALARFYGVKKSLLAAAAEASPPLPTQQSVGADYANWIAAQSVDDKNRWLAELLEDPNSATRARLLAECRRDQPVPSWQVVGRDRAISQLRDAASRHRRAAKAKAERETQEKRRQKLELIAANPQPFLEETEKLIAQRSTAAYEQAAQLLADVRQALAETRHAGLADRHAQKLRIDNPTRRHLISALRRQNFLPK
jgi:hypothetical protein